MSTTNQQVANNLLQLRQTIDEYRIQINQHQAAESLSDQEAAQMFYGVVSSFLSQAEPILTENHVEGSDQLLDTTPLGTVTITPPPFEIEPKAPGGLDPRAGQIAQIKDRYDDEQTQYKLAKDSDIPEPQTVEIHGIKPILSQNTVSASWTVEIVSQRVGSSMERVGKGNWGRETTITNSEPWPVGILYLAARETTKVLANAGIGFNTPKQHD